MDCRFEVALDAYQSGKPLRAAAALVDRSAGWLSKKMVDAGIPRRRPGAPHGPRHKRRVKDQERLDRIIAERERGDTYDAIGFRLGITSERVRQLLKKAGRTDLIGPRKADYVPILVPCAHCGERFEPTTDTMRFCSLKCTGAAKAERWMDENRHRAFQDLQTAIIEYAAGTTWPEIAPKIGIDPDRPQPGAQACRRATLYAKRFGITPPWSTR